MKTVVTRTAISLHILPEPIAFFTVKKIRDLNPATVLIKTKLANHGTPVKSILFSCGSPFSRICVTEFPKLCDFFVNIKNAYKVNSITSLHVIVTITKLPK